MAPTQRGQVGGGGLTGGPGCDVVEVAAPRRSTAGWEHAGGVGQDGLLVLAGPRGVAVVTDLGGQVDHGSQRDPGVGQAAPLGELFEGDQGPGVLDRDQAPVAGAGAGVGVEHDLGLRPGAVGAAEEAGGHRPALVQRQVGILLEQLVGLLGQRGVEGQRDREFDQALDVDPAVGGQVPGVHR